VEFLEQLSFGEISGRGNSEGGNNAELHYFVEETGS
jgi:hypothetical protein